MELRGFPVPTEMQSFPSWNVYYEYIKAYATHFDLHKHIKFLHYVTSVKRVGNVWKVKHRHILKGEEFEEDYDFVIVGTGHFSKPNMPEIPHEKLFKGTIIHSHDYRVPDVFTNRHVLVVGAGPSGMDIALDVAKYSKTLVHSHHSKVNFRTNFPDHYIRKPDIKEFNETGVIFVDGTYEEIDDVIYCTGYEYDYPFLDKSCGLAIDKHSVIPLHKYMVNINEPSMVVMGLVIRACLVVAIDAQARYATALIKGNFTLPSKEEMMSEWQKQADIIRSKGRPISDIHFLAEKEDQYYEKMSEESGIDRVPPVMFKIRTMDTEAKLENLYTYRNYVYEAKSNGPRVCIIGAGIAGLTSAKYLKDEGIDFTVLECSYYVGGMWRYEGRLACDSFDSILHTAMFSDLRHAIKQRTKIISAVQLLKWKWAGHVMRTQRCQVDEVSNVMDWSGKKQEK
ncbi:Flavin-containing monooxygenase FMO GS-OX3 [Papilio xuthus]|uniref:Flavin-containing monooxygenase n=1 Tax=Papilio xuthus TaxID=66420 RepID=A0A0N1IQD4_PAPXU|nr:Flavin-containing monooxygenase FMO GS-OX3 [Papilio xuthus]